MKTQLLATFTTKKDLENTVKRITDAYTIAFKKVYVLQNEDNVDELINLGYKYTENHFKNLRHIDSETVSNED